MARQRWEKLIVSLWWNKFSTPSHDVLITSEEVVLARDNKPIAAAALKPAVGGETLVMRLGPTLKGVMEQAPAVKKQRANIWLSHSLVPHSVVEIDVRVMSAADISATLKAYWEDTLDMPAAILSLTYQVQPSGRSIFSSCCDLRLIETIHASLRSSGWEAQIIAPHLAKTWNEKRRQIRSKDYCLLLFQDKVLSIGVHQNGHWIAWTSEGCDDAEWPELFNRTNRFCRSMGLSDPHSVPVWVHAPQAVSAPSSAGLTNWSLLNTPLYAGLPA